jgi:hypothetical protein
MNRIIKLDNIPSDVPSVGQVEHCSTTSDLYRLTLNILVQNNPNKVTFTLKEAAALLNVGEEFIRRRMKSGAISVTYFGDKPMIHITELTRISLKGI